MHKRTKRFFSISLVFCIMIVSGVYGCFRLLDIISYRREMVDVFHAQQEVDAEKLSRKDELVSEYAYFKQNEGKMENIFIRREELVPVIENLEGLARVYDVSISLDIQEQAVKKQKKSSNTSTEDAEKGKQAEDLRKKTVFLLEIRGTYKNTIRFLTDVEYMFPVPSFESVYMRRYESSDTENASRETPEDNNEEPIKKENEVISSVAISFIQKEETNSES